MEKAFASSKKTSIKSTCIILATLKVRECIFTEYLHHRLREEKRRVKSWENNGFSLLSASVKLGDSDYRSANSYAELYKIIDNEIDCSQR